MLVNTPEPNKFMSMNALVICSYFFLRALSSIRVVIVPMHIMCAAEEIPLSPLFTPDRHDGPKIPCPKGTDYRGVPGYPSQVCPLCKGLQGHRCALQVHNQLADMHYCCTKAWFVYHVNHQSLSFCCIKLIVSKSTKLAYSARYPNYF